MYFYMLCLSLCGFKRFQPWGHSGVPKKEVVCFNSFVLGSNKSQFYKMVK